MNDRLFYTYEIVITLAALITGFATVFALLDESHWLVDAAVSFISVWALILLTCVPVVYLHDHTDNDEYVHRS